MPTMLRYIYEDIHKNGSKSTDTCNSTDTENLEYCK